MKWMKRAFNITAHVIKECKMCILVGQEAESAIVLHTKKEAMHYILKCVLKAAKKQTRAVNIRSFCMKWKCGKLVFRCILNFFVFRWNEQLFFAKYYYCINVQMYKCNASKYQLNYESINVEQEQVQKYNPSC